MPLNLRWVGNDEIDRVAEARMLSYAGGRKELEVYQKDIRDDPRSGPGEWLLAERDGRLAGTATTLPLHMWVRGAKLPCQGVAFVGTVKTERRKSGTEPGVGTALMTEVLRAARDRQFIVSALMPFRATYYEHFGYGIVERKKLWTVPLNIIPPDDFDGIRFYEPRDFEPLVECRNRIARAGQCDMERSAALWKSYIRDTDTGFLIIDRAGDGPIRGWMTIENQHADGLDTVRALMDFGYEDVATLRRFLHFLGSLKDQYRFASLRLPADFPLNLLLNEKQMTHRASKNHPNADARPYTRMQVRVLDHRKLIECMILPSNVAGRCVVAIHETEGDVSKIEIDLSDAKAACKPASATADIELNCATWAMVVLGDVRASLAAELGLMKVHNAARATVLDVFAEGDPPYCREYF